MAERKLQRIAAAGCLVWALLVVLPDPIHAAPAPGGIAFDSLVVAPAVFSPNGDAQQDIVRISYRLREQTDVTVLVGSPGGTDTLRLLVSNATQAGDRTHTVPWDGRATDSTVVSDGDYEIRLHGQAVSGSTVDNRRRVRVDTRAAVAAIDSLDPGVYTPTVEGSVALPRVGVRVTDSDPGDSLHVELRVNGSTGRTFRLRLQQNTQVLQGDGFYWAACDSCVRDRAVPDGLHKVTAITRDAAANVDSSLSVRLDKNIRGPRLGVRHPLAGSLAHVQRADSLVATAYDRHGVEGVWLWIDGQTDSLLLSGGVPPGDTVHVFRADLATLLAAEGRYPLRLQGADPFGVEGDLRYTIVVDRTPPSAPQLDPRPAPVSKTQALDVSVAFDRADAVYQLIRTGGALPADTTRVPSSGPARIQVILEPGANALSFATRDSALNVSPAETLTVVWETSRGISCPERFRAGNRIQVHMGSVPGEGVEIRVLATDGSLVQRFEDGSRKLIYEFTWDLRTPEGLQVKNGAYLLLARLRDSGGGEQRITKLIAVLE